MSSDVTEIGFDIDIGVGIDIGLKLPANREEHENISYTVFSPLEGLRMTLGLGLSGV